MHSKPSGPAGPWGRAGAGGLRRLPAQLAGGTMCSSLEESLGSDDIASNWLWLVAVGCAFHRQT